jgi:hypothetical protein
VTRIISPAPQFASLTEAEGTAALDDPDPRNPIAVEAARLMEGYSENFRAHVERLGYIPDSFLRLKPQTAIEAVAMRLTSEAIQEAPQIPLRTPPPHRILLALR